MNTNWTLWIIGATLNDVKMHPASGRFLALTTTVLLWASAFPAIRVAVDGLGVPGVSLLRLTVASTTLAAAAKILKVRRPRRHDLPRIALCGATGMSAYQLFLNWGELHVPAGTASLLIKIAPIISALLAAAFLGERLTSAVVAGSTVAIGGTVVVALSGGSVQFSASAVIVLAAGVVQGIYHFATKPLLQRYTGLEVACYAMWAGTLLLVPLAPAAVPDLTAAPVPAVLTTVYLGLLPSALGFVTWGYAIARYTLAQATAALYLVPPVTMAIAFAWLGEIPSLTALLGGLASVAGVVLINHPPGHHVSGYRRFGRDASVANFIAGGGSLLRFPTLLGLAFSHWRHPHIALEPEIPKAPEAGCAGLSRRPPASAQPCARPEGCESPYA